MIEVTEEGAGVETERGKLSAAIETAKGQLEALRAQLQAKADPAKAAIFAAHEELIEDPDLLEIVDSAIAKGKSAEFGWKKAVTTHADRLAALRNPLLAQRANDLRDVGLRVLGILTGEETKAPDYPPNTILIAEDLTPSDTAALDRTRVMGFATTRGGATSHVAILARSLGIPALAGIEPAALEIPNGTSVVLDGSKGTLRLNPPPEEITRIRSAQERAEKQRKEDLAHAHEPAVTLDGKRIEVVANIGGLKDATQVSALGGEGVGLLRSEFLFMERSTRAERRRTVRSLQSDRAGHWQRASARHSHARRRRRQTTRLSADSERRQSVSGRTRRARRARSSRDLAHSTARHSSRISLRPRERDVPDDFIAAGNSRCESDSRGRIAAARHRADSRRHHGGSSGDCCDGGAVRERSGLLLHRD